MTSYVDDNIFPKIILSGLTGSTQAMRIVGATASGAPTTGAHLVGDASLSLADGIWYVCSVLGTPGTWVTSPASSGYPVLTSLSNKLGADVTMTSANTYYDGPAQALTAGTWFLTGAVTLTMGVSNAHYTIKLWDGSTIIASGQQTQTVSSGWQLQLAVSGFVTTVGTPTLKISAASSTTGAIIAAAAANNGAGNNASFLNALRIA